MAILFPSHAYVPGRTPRHPETAFDGLKQVGTPLRDSPAWQAGLAFFDAGYFWEAHEVWEVVWMAAPANSPEKALVQGMIQLANAGLKRRMGRPRAAGRLDVIADALLSDATGRGGATGMGLDPRRIAEAQQAVAQEHAL